MSIIEAEEIMEQNQRNQIAYTVACVNEFARRKALHPQKAFFYLEKYRGIRFLRENYEIEHTLSMEDAVDDLEIICQKNGGTL